MTVYFDHITNPVQFTTAALDPANEVGTFLSYKLTDWVNKIGPNYAYIITNHEDWQASSTYQSGSWGRFTTSYIEIGFNGPDFRSGELVARGRPPSVAIRLGRGSSDYFYMYKGSVVKRIDVTGSYQDRTNILRNAWGFASFDHDHLAYSVSDCFEDRDFTTAKPVFVLYNDEPGKRFFAWNMMGGYTSSSTLGFTGVIMEITPKAGRSQLSDCGWVLLTSAQDINELMLHDPNLTYNDRYKMEGTTGRYFNYYGPGASKNSSIANPLLGSAPLTDRHGDLLGSLDMGWASQVDSFEEFFVYRIDGKKYMAWFSRLLLPID